MNQLITVSDYPKGYALITYCSASSIDLRLDNFDELLKKIGVAASMNGPDYSYLILGFPNDSPERSRVVAKLEELRKNEQE